MIFEKRKLILFGKNSHIITLPQKWLKKSNLKKGDEILIKQKNDKLIICKNIESETKIKIAKINFNNKPLKVLNKQVISYYLKNNKFIEIIGKNLLNHINEITILKNKLSSVEIVNMSDTKIILEDLTKLEELKVDEIIKNMIDMIIVCFENLENESKNLNLIFDIDKTINKLMFLGSKKINFLIEEGMEENLLCLVEKKKLINSLEFIGDSIKRASRVLLEFPEDKYSLMKKIIIETQEYFSFIMLFLEEDVDYEKNLEIYLDRKNSLFILYDIERNKSEEHKEFFYLMTQHFKNIVGELDNIILSLIDMRLEK